MEECIFEKNRLKLGLTQKKQIQNMLQKVWIFIHSILLFCEKKYIPYERKRYVDEISWKTINLIFPSFFHVLQLHQPVAQNGKF